MPNILVKVPKDAFPAEHRTRLVHALNQAAAEVEQVPDEPAPRALCWVVIEEVEPGGWTGGGRRLDGELLPCLAMVYLPAGVLDGATRAACLRKVHEAFAQALPSGERRRLATSVVLHEVGDGAWGVNGMAWRLPDFARAAGYAHLQSLVPAR